MKRTLSLLLALVLLLSLPAAGFAITDSERYADTLSRLQDYLSTGKSLSHEERITVLDSLFMNFFEQYGYEMGAQFSSYVDILRMIENCDFGQTYVKIEKLRKSLTFDALLQQDPGAYGTLRQLEAYMLARKAENEGDKETALQYYYNCGDYFDSYLRSNSLADTRYKTMYSEAKQCILDGNFERAYILLQELATIHYEQSDNLLIAVKDSLGISAAVAETPPQPEPAAEPNPPAEVVPESFTLRAYPGEKNISLKWEYSASSFAVYRKSSNADAYERIGQTSNTAYVDNDATPNRSYSYYVATENNTAKSNEVTSATTKETERKWSAWSSWSTSYVAANNDCQVETKTQYAYEDTTYQTTYSA